MVCKRCGAKLNEGDLFCLKCGQEVQIVPDYSPVEEMVVKNVAYLQNDNYEVKSEEELSQPEKEKPKEDNTKSIQKPLMEDIKKTQKRTIILAVIVVALIVTTIAVNATIIYRRNHSFEYQKACGYVEIENHSYEKALSYFQKALKLNESDLEIRFLISDTALKLDNIQLAQSMLLEIISMDPENVDAGKELLKLYSDNGMSSELTGFFEKINGTKLYNSLIKYHVKKPEFSTQPGNYERFITVEITCESNCRIYYTIDGSAPTVESAVPYSGIIRLPNGSTTIKAIAVNNEGYISEQLEGEYTVHYKAPNNPVIMPKGGDYYYAVPITISVPEECTVYYTTDGSNPTEHSNKYHGYIDMPLGSSNIQAVAIDASGFVSSTVSASYNLNFDSRFSTEQADMIIMAHLANNSEDERGVFDLHCEGAFSVGEFNLYIFEKVYGTDINGNRIVNEEQKFAFDVLTGETYIAYPNGAGDYSLEAF